MAAGVSAGALFSGACWLVLRRLAGAGIFSEPLVPPARAGARPAGHTHPATAPGVAERWWAGAVWPHHDVCGCGLADVTGAAVVFDRLWTRRDDRAVTGSHGVCHCHHGLAGQG